MLTDCHSGRSHACRSEILPDFERQPLLANRPDTRNRYCEGIRPQHIGMELQDPLCSTVGVCSTNPDRSGIRARKPVVARETR
jgi:hypothetical protein